MFCPKCKAEYVRGITMCADCNIPLVHELPAESVETERDTETGIKENKNITAEQAENLDPNKFEEFYLNFGFSEIAIIKSLLDQAGIRYYSLGEYRLPVRLLVYNEDADDAAAIIEDFEKSHPPEVDPGNEPEADHNIEPTPGPNQTDQRD
jgi:hypothetical protein